MSDFQIKTATVEDRARATLGISADPILRLVDRVIGDSHPGGGTLVDLGCGRGDLGRAVAGRFDHYIGVDVVHYDGFPESAEFHKVDLDTGRVPLPDGLADVVAAVETIEHVENPRAFMRELARLARPGALIVVTTPNQLSLLSKLTLILKNQFNAFTERPGSYPAHITALLEIDLVRIARECGLADPKIRYTDSGRIPGTAKHWPWGLGGRAFSDNLLLETRRPPGLLS
ncbi:MAG: methyltransferase domain-containing protein [Isosphaeraceae bacterium]